jgi:hypothetical protein
MKSKTLTPLPKLLKKAQTIFNAWIRDRDKHKGCISCNGQVEQAGHYLSQGNHSRFRFDELNVNGQCIRCNMYLSGNLIRYRQGLVNRYGEGVVLELENFGDSKYKWTRDELETIIKKYKL